MQAANAPPIPLIAAFSSHIFQLSSIQPFTLPITARDVRSHRCLVRAFRCQPCHKFHKIIESNIQPKCKNKDENTKVLNKQKRTICMFKCWLNFQLASFKTLMSREKKPINGPTPSWSAVPFSRLVVQKRYPSKLGNFYVVSYHIGQTCSVKEFWCSRNGASPCITATASDNSGMRCSRRHRHKFSLVFSMCVRLWIIPASMHHRLWHRRPLSCLSRSRSLMPEIRWAVMPETHEHIRPSELAQVAAVKRLDGK